MVHQQPVGAIRRDGCCQPRRGPAPCVNPERPICINQSRSRGLSQRFELGSRILQALLVGGDVLSKHVAHTVTLIAAKVVFKQNVGALRRSLLVVTTRKHQLVRDLAHLLHWHENFLVIRHEEAREYHFSWEAVLWVRAEAAISERAGVYTLKEA